MTFVNTPLNYTGSKFKLLDQIIPHFDRSKKYFVDLFCGGGSVFTNVVDLYEKIIVNDIIIDLVNIHKSLTDGDIEFVSRVKELSSNKDDKQKYLDLRTSYNKEKTPEKLFALMLSCTNNMMRFNNSFEFN